MTGFSEKIRKKLKSRRGMTIAELLAATMVLLLVVTGLTTGISMASRHYTRSVQTSEAQELYSTLKTILTNELRYTTEVELTGDQVDKFYSITYAVHNDLTALVALKSDTAAGSEETADHGELALGSEGEYNRILGSAAYPNGLTAAGLIGYDQEAETFTVTLSIYDASDEVILEEAFMVRAMNEVAVH